VQDDLDSLHRSILLKPNDRVNRASDETTNATDSRFCAFAHRIGDSGVMCVKDYFHN
jgi:hypothetical protein